MKLKSLHSLLLIFLLGVITIFSCKKNIKNEMLPVSPGDVMPIPAATPVNGSVSGLIVDENNTPVEGAAAKLGALTATTNARGIFSFDNATLDKYITTVTVEMPGYFKAYRSFSANATRNYISIKLLPKTISGTVNSTSASTVSLSNGTQLSFQANSVVIKSSGAPYSGNVKIFATYIDPTASDIGSIVPGSFMGRDANNIYTLQSTGMIAVDLESDNGEPLQLASNLPATIKMPIPASLLSKAPSSIDTWSLDEQGVWKKEGSAPRTGDFYEMQVTHFSFWNCDYSQNSIYLTLHVQDHNGSSLANTFVQLSVLYSNTWLSATYGYTDSLGNVSGLVPAAMDIEMKIFANTYSCSTPVSTQTIGPFTTNTSLSVTTSANTTQLLTITGTAVDCNGSPVQNGTAIINAGRYAYYNTTIINGNYNISVATCSAIDTINVTAVDYNDNSQGNSGLVTVSGNSVTVPAISACGSSTVAVFTFGNILGNCSVLLMSGVYTTGVPLTSNNIIKVLVNVVTPGSYNITSSMGAGFSFSGTGTFTNTGAQYVNLIASGTPMTAGNNNFIFQSGGFANCPFVIFVNTPAALFDLSSCSNIEVNGIYMALTNINSSNSVTLTVNVITPGGYYITTNAIDGMSFQDSGFAAVAGPLTITLPGSGAPSIAATNTFTLESGGVTGCSFNVTIQPSSSAADFTFDGAPGACTSNTVNGVYTAGNPLTTQNTVSLLVNVTTPGYYTASTNSANGMVFSGSGVFAATGAALMTLYADGIPANTGTTSFTPQSASGGSGMIIEGCAFSVQVN